MSEFNALLRSVIQNPEEDSIRLVMADWLQENGQEARAEFIRCQVELARLGPPHIVVSEKSSILAGYGPNYYSLTGGEETVGGGRLAMENCVIGSRVDVLKPREGKKPLYGLRVSKITSDEYILVRDEFSKPWGGKKLAERAQALWDENCADWMPMLPGASQYATHASSMFEKCGQYAVQFGTGRESDLGRVELLTSRGFVSEVRCTWKDWLASEKVLYWHPDKLVVCGRCDEDGKAHGSDRPFEWSDDPNHMKCPVCNGNKQTKMRHCPDTAQPLRKIHLDRNPVDWLDSDMQMVYVRGMTAAETWDVDELLAKFPKAKSPAHAALEYIWPGLEFVLPLSGSQRVEALGFTLNPHQRQILDAIGNGETGM